MHSSNSTDYDPEFKCHSDISSSRNLRIRICRCIYDAGIHALYYYINTSLQRCSVSFTRMKLSLLQPNKCELRNALRNKKTLHIRLTYSVVAVESVLSRSFVRFLFFARVSLQVQRRIKRRITLSLSAVNHIKWYISITKVAAAAAAPPPRHQHHYRVAHINSISA